MVSCLLKSTFLPYNRIVLGKWLTAQALWFSRHPPPTHTHTHLASQYGHMFSIHQWNVSENEMYDF